MTKHTRKALRTAAWAAGMAALATATAVAAKNWDNWAAPANLESLPGSGTELNTASVDGCASHSRDGLTIAFNSNRSGNQEIYLATRSSTSEGFGEPVPLPSPINEASNEACPTIANGNRLYFSSDRHDTAYDLYVSKLGPNGWSTPGRLGGGVNANGTLEEAVDFYQDDEGREVMIFTRRLGAVGKIYQVVDGGTPSLVQGGPHSSASDSRASVTSDGLTMFWDSTRTGTLGGPDLYYATRSSTSDPWGTAIHLPSLSSTGFDARPYISKDGTFLTYSSARGSAIPDIWFTTREKITGQDR